MRANVFIASLLAAYVGVAHAALVTAPAASEAAALSADKKPSVDKRRHVRSAPPEKTFVPVLWDQLDADRLMGQSKDAPAPNFPPERR